MITYNLSLLASLYNNFDFFIVFRPNLTLIWPWSETLQKKCFFEPL